MIFLNPLADHFKAKTHLN